MKISFDDLKKLYLNSGFSEKSLEGKTTDMQYKIFRMNLSKIYHPDTIKNISGNELERLINTVRTVFPGYFTGSDYVEIINEILEAIIKSSSSKSDNGIQSQPFENKMLPLLNFFEEESKKHPEYHEIIAEMKFAFDNIAKTKDYNRVSDDMEILSYMYDGIIKSIEDGAEVLEYFLKFTDGTVYSVMNYRKHIIEEAKEVFKDYNSEKGRFRVHNFKLSLKKVLAAILEKYSILDYVIGYFNNMHFPEISDRDFNYFNNIFTNFDWDVRTIIRNSDDSTNYIKLVNGYKKIDELIKKYDIIIKNLNLCMARINEIGDFCLTSPSIDYHIDMLNEIIHNLKMQAVKEEKPISLQQVAMTKQRLSAIFQEETKDINRMKGILIKLIENYFGNNNELKSEILAEISDIKSKKSLMDFPWLLLKYLFDREYIRLQGLLFETAEDSYIPYYITCIKYRFDEILKYAKRSDAIKFKNNKVFLFEIDIIEIIKLMGQFKVDGNIVELMESPESAYRCLDNFYIDIFQRICKYDNADMNSQKKI